MNPTEQLADLTARLKQAEAERDAALKKIPRNLAEACYAEDRNQDELFERINLIMGTRPIEECTQADFKWACGNCWTDGYDGSVEIVRAPDWPPLTDEQATAILDLGFHCIYESPPGVEDYADVGTCWTRRGKSTCSARSYSDNKPREAKAIRDRDAAIAKLADVEAEAAAMREALSNVEKDYGHEWPGETRGDTSYRVEIHRKIQSALSTTAGTELLEDLKTLRTALEQYANPGNWHVGSKYDGESRSFTGPEEARKALDETERG